MWRKLLLGCLALLLVAGGLLYMWQNTQVYAASIAVSAAPTPDATAAIDAANNAVSRAQDLLSVINTYAAVLGVVLTFFGLIVIVLGVLGFRSYGEVRSLEKDLRASLEKVQDEADETRKEADKTRSALVYLGLGDRLLSLRNTEEALENYKQAGKLLPKDAQVQYMLGRVYSGVGDYEDAITALEASNPEDTISKSRVEKELGLAYRRRGKAHNQEADYNQAIQHLQNAAGLNSHDSDTFCILGGLYRRKGEYVSAYDEYERAHRIDHESSYALGNLASLSWYLAKTDEERVSARGYFADTERAARDRIRQGQSDAYWDYYDLGLAQLAQGKKAEAKATYTTAIQDTPGTEQYNSVLDNLYLLQKAQQQIDGLDEIVKLIEAARK